MTARKSAAGREKRRERHTPFNHQQQPLSRLYDQHISGPISHIRNIVGDVRDRLFNDRLIGFRVANSSIFQIGNVRDRIFRHLGCQVDRARSDLAVDLEEWSDIVKGVCRIGRDVSKFYRTARMPEQQRSRR